MGNTNSQMSAVAACDCETACDPSCDPAPGAESQDTSVAATTAIVSSGTAVAACAACCVVPLAWPAITLAVSGSVFAWFEGAHPYFTAVSVACVAGAWAFVMWQSGRSRKRPRAVTLAALTAATVMMGVAVMWLSIEPFLLEALSGPS